MSLQKEKKRVKSEMKAGVHLASILDMKKHLDDQKNPIIVDGELAILVTFINGQNQYHDQVYWLGKGNDGKEKFFTQMCLDAGIDMSKTPLAKKEALNKRLWIAIREVFTLVNNGESIKKDILGNDVVEHFVFKTAPIWDVDKQPTWKGDPLFNDGVACEEFVGYKEENESGWDTLPKGEAPAVIEIKAVTPEIEKAVVETPKKEKAPKEEVSPVTNTAQPNFGDTPAVVTPKFDAPTNTPTPNFGEPVATSNTPNFGENDSPDDNFGS